jgi:uncharacterized damage-inducible protein DinB
VWHALKARRMNWLRTADPRARVEFVPDAGGIASVQAWECLVHLTTHAHFHRGQLVSQCRALGVTPPSRHLLGAFFGEF